MPSQELGSAIATTILPSRQFARGSRPCVGDPRIETRTATATWAWRIRGRTRVVRATDEEAAVESGMLRCRHLHFLVQVPHAGLNVQNAAVRYHPTITWSATYAEPRFIAFQTVWPNMRNGVGKYWALSECWTCRLLSVEPWQSTGLLNVEACPMRLVFDAFWSPPGLNSFCARCMFMVMIPVLAAWSWFQSLPN